MFSNKLGNLFITTMIFSLSACVTLREPVAKLGDTLRGWDSQGYDAPSGTHYENATGVNSHRYRCSALPEFSKKLDHGFAGESCLNGSPLPRFNLAVLKQAGLIPPGGGYDWQSSRATASNQNLDVCGKRVLNGGPSSHCSGSYYVPAMRAMEATGIFKQMGLCDADQSSLKKYLGTSSAFFQTLNNSKIQMGNAASRWGFGSVVVNRPNLSQIMANACAGDAFSFSRKIGGTIHGHQWTFLGVKDGMVYGFGANKATNGWGVDCWPADKFLSGDFAITRVNTVEKGLANVVPGARLPASISPFNEQSRITDAKPLPDSALDGSHI